MTSMRYGSDSRWWRFAHSLNPIAISSTLSDCGPKIGTCLDNKPMKMWIDSVGNLLICDHISKLESEFICQIIRLGNCI